MAENRLAISRHERHFRLAWLRWARSRGGPGDTPVVLIRGPRQCGHLRRLHAARARLRAADFRGPRKLEDTAGKRFVAGVVLYDGEACAPFGEGLYAVPIRALRETI